MDIKPGIGVGLIKYGITESKLIELFASPDLTQEEEYLEGEGDWHRMLWYYSRNLIFTFNKDEQYRLGLITVMGTGYSLFDKDIFGLPIDTVKRYLARATSEIPKYEDLTWGDDALEILEHDGLEIMCWFESGFLYEMQCGYLFESDGNTEIWP